MGKPAALAAGVGTSKSDKLQGKIIKKRCRTSVEPYAMMQEEPFDNLCFKGALANASADTMDSGGETEASHKSGEAAEVASHSGCASRELQ